MPENSSFGVTEVRGSNLPAAQLRSGVRCWKENIAEDTSSFLKDFIQIERVLHLTARKDRGKLLHPMKMAQYGGPGTHFKQGLVKTKQGKSCSESTPSHTEDLISPLLRGGQLMPLGSGRRLSGRNQQCWQK